MMATLEQPVDGQLLRASEILTYCRVADSKIDGLKQKLEQGMESTLDVPRPLVAEDYNNHCLYRITKEVLCKFRS